MKEYEKNKIPFSNIVNHPDLHFAYPCISKSKPILQIQIYYRPGGILLFPLLMGIFMSG